MHVFCFLFAIQFAGLAGITPVVAFPDGVQELERVAIPRIQSGEWKRFTSVQDLSRESVVFALGSFAARGIRDPGARVIEFFVAGTPLVEGHEIISWEAPVEAWQFLLDLFPQKGRDVPFCALSTSRTRIWTEQLVSRSGDQVVLVQVSGISAALEVAAELLEGSRHCSGVILTNDFEILDADVLMAFLQVQVRLGVPLFARTRHEVLRGAAATVEPRYQSWDPSSEAPVSGQIFYQRDVLAWLGIRRPTSHEGWNPQPMTR